MNLENMQNFSLHELKERGKKLGLRGLTSRTKYTKNNKEKLIEDILKIKETQNFDKTSTPQVQKSVKNLEEQTSTPQMEQTSTPQKEKSLETQDEKHLKTSPFLWLIMGSIIVGGSGFLIFHGIRRPKKQQRVENVI